MVKKYSLVGAVMVFVALAAWSSGSLGAHAQSVSATGVTAPAAPSIQIAPQILPDAVAGTPYSQTFSVVSNEGGPFYWTVDGTLPDGLSLDTGATGSESELSGVPSTAGTWTFMISVTNRNVAATETYVFTVDAEGTASASGAPPVVIMATSTGVQSEIAAVTAEIQQLESELDNGTSSQGDVLGASIGPVVTDASIFYRDLTLGDVGPDVFALQQFLNNEGYTIVASGPGSPGDETDFFGALMQAALARWQAAEGISPATGYFGPITRSRIIESDATSTSLP
jgi:hypothetical protein